jgi:hypothetical protein
MDLALTVVSVALVAAAFFFWGRGIIKSRKDDIVFGFCILIFICLFSMVIAHSSAIFAQLGILFILFGVHTLAVSAFAKGDCPLSKKERTGLAIAALTIGAFASMFV